MFRYRMLFLSKKTFYTAAIAALVLFPLGTVLTGISGELTVLLAALPILCTVLCVGLIAVYRSENLIHLSGLLGAALLLELFRYLYLTEQTLQLGAEGIVSKGLYFSMLFTGYIMVAFVITVVTYDHFTLQLGRASTRTKMVVNQTCILVLFLCFLSMIVERWMMGGLFLPQLAEALSYLADLCLFVLIACCDMILTVDGQTLFSQSRRKEGGV